MGKPTGFKEHTRELPGKRSARQRVLDNLEIHEPFPEKKLQAQAARCMDCGVPFCQPGCPLGNIIPDWNDLVYRGLWDRALDRLLATNNFPEFTGRVCPAPCEEACVLGVVDPPVTIEEIEKTIVEHAFEAGWIRPTPPTVRTGKRVVVVGSGPAGLACAQQLNRAGHSVTVLERADRIGGLLRYGIPDFKLEKRVLERRVRLLDQEGVVFHANVNVGVDYPVEKLREFAAAVLCGGATRPRDLTIPGRDLAGVCFAMEYLTQQSRRVAGDSIRGLDLRPITAEGKNVIIIGGGDTGSDCVGTANRQGAKSVTQFELLPMPPVGRPGAEPWPFWPVRMRTSSSHEEGCDRHWSVLTKAFIGENGSVTGIRTVNVEFVPSPDGEGSETQEHLHTEQIWKADLAVLAMGFLGPEPDGMIARLGIELDGRGTVKTGEDYMTNVSGIFAAGDMRRGQSLVVWAISEGREAARAVDLHLMGETALPTKGEGDLPRP